MKWYSVESTVAMNGIRHRFSPPGERSDTDSVDNTNTEIITRHNGYNVIVDEWEKLETIASNALFIITKYIIFYFMYFILFFFFSLKSCNFIIIIN